LRTPVPSTSTQTTSRHTTRKSPTDWRDDVATLLKLGVGPTTTVVDLGARTGTFGHAIAPYVARVVSVDASEPMVARMRARGVEAVCAGFLGYEHDGDPPGARGVQKPGSRSGSHIGADIDSFGLP
jgi:SAM-dependent methyltransferase